MNDADRGSVVVVALVVILLGGIAVSTLTSFNAAVIRSQNSRLDRIALEREVDAALLIATASQQAQVAGSPSTCTNSSMMMEDVEIDIACAHSAGSPSGTKAGLVATLHSSSADSQTLPVWAGGIAQAIDGAVVVNTGTLTSPGVAYLSPDRGDSSSPWVTLPTTWSSYASRGSPDEPNSYPPLPSIPLYERPGAQTTIGTCSIYFPGRYLGTTSLTLNGGSHYFTSGVYYFERPLVVNGGAQVVMGLGRYPGCSNDADAVSSSKSPQRHAISGAGATLLFGGSARLVVQDASMIFNARNGGTEPSIRTVGFGTSTSSIAIPADTVIMEDGTSVPASAHSMLPPESATPVSYKTSTLTPTTSLAVSVTLNGSRVDTNRIIVEGQIFVPHGGVHVASSGSAYQVSLTGGIVTSRLTTSLPYAPSGSDFELGYLETTSPSATMSIEARTTRDLRTFTSRAEFVIVDSTWSLISRSRRHRNDLTG